MSEMELRDALTNYRRSIEHLGQALVEAAHLATDEDDVVTLTRLVERGLVRREMLIDFLAADLVLRCLVGLLAAKSGSHPQHVLGEHFKAAPTRAQWEALKPKPDQGEL